MAGRLARKVALITGGVGGIGSAIAAGFASEGATVCIADMSGSAAEATAAEIGSGAFGVEVDVTQSLSIDRMVAEVVERAGGIDILVNNAGVFSLQSLLDVTETEFQKVIDVNVKGVLFVTQAVAGQMIKQGRPGKIVNISSGAGRRGEELSITYCASKSAVISLTQSCANTLIRYKINVNAIAPGGVQTEMWDKLAVLYGRQLNIAPEDFTKAYVERVPAGRMGYPPDFVGIATFLASPESDYITGQTMNVDGGLYMN